MPRTRLQQALMACACCPHPSHHIACPDCCDGLRPGPPAAPALPSHPLLTRGHGGLARMSPRAPCRPLQRLGRPPVRMESKLWNRDRRRMAAPRGAACPARPRPRRPPASGSFLRSRASLASPALRPPVTLGMPFCPFAHTAVHVLRGSPTSRPSLRRYSLREGRSCHCHVHM